MSMNPVELDRRRFLDWTARGLGSVALAGLLSEDGRARSGSVPGEAEDPPPHHPPRAVRAIQICLCGAMSQVDTFDHKPALARFHGTPLPSDSRPDVFFGQVGLLRQSDWAFRRRGDSGLWVSDLFPNLAGVADELTVINSMVAETSNHTPATFQENTGFRLNGFPVLGSWLSYGLGSESEDLPSFVVIPDARGFPAGGTINWTNGFLPARHQGVAFRSKGPPIDDLVPAQPVSDAEERATRSLLSAMNDRHLAHRGGEDDLSARVRSYELAARMQLAVPEVADLSAETPETRALYGLDRPETEEFGRRCLLARRLVERGVRFVQLYHGGGPGNMTWDAHGDIEENHLRMAGEADRPIAGLLTDLKRRGLLDNTLVVCGGEFGRTPMSQGSTGRDHNPYGFSMWLAGGGVQGGRTVGSTDDFGLRAAENPRHVRDLHATILHLLGLDQYDLTVMHDGREEKLTDTGGEVITEIL
jgi:hypothetical protein